jgi:catechol 2,3-dioxygenase-like lactoylglutathione lyase family enzyme
VIDVQRVDYIRIPATDMEKANHFYGEVLGLARNPNSPGDDWVEYETGNVTLAVMTPYTHDYEFTPLPPGTIALRVPDVAEAKAKLEAAGVQVHEMWDSSVCHGPGSATLTATRSSSTTATSHTSRPDKRPLYVRWHADR